ncbi:MAG: hypothetical protein LBQ35_04155 [Spirochaetaceae bacterium]|jgi:hypothetical protein|nr:hypothetical protein [Spirochaetaceae bacterium]
MGLFCILWAPLVLLLWRSLAGGGNAGAVWAFLLGAAAALLHGLAGSFVEPRGFGLFRGLYVLVDIILLPAALPFLAALLLTLCRPSGTAFNLRLFALVWLIPQGLFRAMFWSGPLFLILAPLLWTALALGVPFFIDMAGGAPGLRSLPGILGAALLPLAAAACFWAFFGQRPVPGAAALAAVLAPALVSVFGAAQGRAGSGS